MSSIVRSSISRSGLALGLTALAACSNPSTDPATPDTSGLREPSSESGGGRPNDGTLPFTPSNGVSLASADLSKATDEVSLTGSCTIDGATSTIDCDSQGLHGSYATKIVTLADQTRVSLFVAKSFRIETSTTVRTKGALPIVLAALDDLSVFGTVIVIPGTSGGAAETPHYLRGGGAGGGSAASESGLAGGGGSFCGLGGRGGAAATDTLAPSPAYGNPELVPLVGGSGGATSFFSGATNPGGGGALQLLAGRSIFIAASGAVSLPGGAGDRGDSEIGGPGKFGAGGGGSGGALLVEAPVVRVEGTFAANGGGGGGAGDGGTPGAYGTAEARAAKGGGGPVLGGDGSSATAIGGTDGIWDPTKRDRLTNDSAAASGGGGGAGRIRINTSTGHAIVTGVVAPALTTPCASEGTFHH
ncbi:hypothetical protein BH11MYX4_BH11MYX4_36390 [soil metagenome]